MREPWRSGRWVAVVTLLAACQRDYPFHTVAVYEAPRGRYSIRIDCEGVVRAGHDVSQESSGLLTVSPSSGPGPSRLAPLSVNVALRGSRVHFGGVMPEGAWTEPGGPALSRLLSEGGYALHADELAELTSALEGALAGPKGTLMSGQSRSLRVVSTTFGR